MQPQKPQGPGRPKAQSQSTQLTGAPDKPLFSDETDDDNMMSEVFNQPFTNKSLKSAAAQKAPIPQEATALENLDPRSPAMRKAEAAPVTPAQMGGVTNIPPQVVPAVPVVQTARPGELQGAMTMEIERLKTEVLVAQQNEVKWKQSAIQWENECMNARSEAVKYRDAYHKELTKTQPEMTTMKRNFYWEEAPINIV